MSRHDEIDDPLPGPGPGAFQSPRQPGVMRASGETQYSPKIRPAPLRARPPDGPCGNRPAAIDRRIHGHGRDDDGPLWAARICSGVNIGGIVASSGSHPEAPGEPALIAFEPGLVPHADSWLMRCERVSREYMNAQFQPVCTAAADNSNHPRLRAAFCAATSTRRISRAASAADRDGAVAQPGELRGEPMASSKASLVPR